MVFYCSIMTWLFTRILAVTLASTMVAACAGDKGQYPSLAIRDVERVSGDIATTPSVEPVDLPIRPLVPSQDITSLVAQANRSHQNFQARAPSVRRLATLARGTGRDSGARGNALVALSDLTSMRSQTEIALADLDLLIAERTNRLQPADDAIAAHARVLELVTAQDRTLNSLWSLVGR